MTAPPPERPAIDPEENGALTPVELGELAGFAAQLADAAGEAIRPLFRRLDGVDSKSDLSPVTEADRASEQAMRALIAARYPAHGIYGEEFGVANPDAPLLWILDPIDGTKSFVAGLPIFATLIALADGEGFALGVIDQPIVADRWVGVRGIGTAHNGAPARTRRGTRLAEAVMATTSIEFMSAAERAAVEDLLRAGRLYRLCGDAYVYGLLASGQIDIVLGRRGEALRFRRPGGSGRRGRRDHYRLAGQCPAGRPAEPGSGRRRCGAPRRGLALPGAGVIAPAVRRGGTGFATRPVWPK